MNQLKLTIKLHTRDKRGRMRTVRAETLISQELANLDFLKNLWEAERTLNQTPIRCHISLEEES